MKAADSAFDRRRLLEPFHPNISIVRQCQLLDISRSSYYYRPTEDDTDDISIMNMIDEIYTRHPYYGSPKITAQLKRDGLIINHKRVERLMREMAIQAIFPKKFSSQANPNHLKYPYLLNGLDINYPNQVWGTDITYVRSRGSWFYLVAILDWFSRYVIAWRLSSNLSTGFCLDALAEALNRAKPEIHNSDQGSQFTSQEYIALLNSCPKIKISMDGKGRCFDNIFTERLWRTVKYEEVYLKDYRSFNEADNSLAEYFRKYNHERLHESLNYSTPAEIYFNINL